MGGTARGIAVIDDIPDNTELIEATLSSICTMAEVSTFNSGRTFLTAFKNNSYAVILLDLFMPDLDGYQVCKSIRKIDALVPVIAFTAYPEERDRALHSGFTAFIAKPIVDVNRFCELVRGWMDHRKAS